MFKRMLLVILVCSIVFSASLIGYISSDTSHQVDNSSDTVVAARMHTIDIAIVADPQCPTGSSGTGGGC